MADNKDTERLWTTKQVAEYLVVAPHTLKLWVAQGCPAYRLGPTLLRFRLAEVLGWLQNRPRVPLSGVAAK